MGRTFLRFWLSFNLREVSLRSKVIGHVQRGGRTRTCAHCHAVRTSRGTSNALFRCFSAQWLTRERSLVIQILLLEKMRGVRSIMAP